MNEDKGDGRENGDSEDKESKNESNFLTLARVPQLMKYLMIAANGVDTGVLEEEGVLACDRKLVEEAMYRATKTVKYHENTKLPNHRKEIAHFCHWLMRLKPLTALRSSDFTNTQRAKLGLEEPNPENIPPKEETRNQRRINEISTVRLACLLFEEMELELIDLPLEDENIDKAEAESLRAERLWLADRINQVWAFSQTLAYSFREHTYSARATAVLFELAFAPTLLDETNGLVAPEEDDINLLA